MGLVLQLSVEMRPYTLRQVLRAVECTDVHFKSFDQHASLFLGLPSVNMILIGVLGEEAYIQGMQSVGH